ncbi:MAG: membrane dipeptidase [Myxococcota bacterium]
MTERDAPARAGIPEEARALHARVLALDAHADLVLPTTNPSYLAKDGTSKVSPERMREGGLDAVVLAIAVEPQRRNAEGFARAAAIAAEKLAAFRRIVDDHPDVVAATTPKEIEGARAEGRRALVLGFQNALILGTDPDAVVPWFEAGCRVFALTHMGHNDFADSSRPLYRPRKRAYEPTEEHGGLSPLGEAALDRIVAHGGLVDVSQLSRNATLQAIERTRRPIVATHSNVRAISDVTRNLSGEEIDAIARSGGVVHVSSFAPYLPRLGDPALMARVVATRREHGLPETFSYPFELYWEIEDVTARTAFLTAMRGLIRDLSVEDMLDHVDHLAERVGVDHIGVGNDFNHGTNVRGFRDATEAGHFTAGLMARGYGEDDIARIWSGNFLRALKAAQDGATV